MNLNNKIFVKKFNRKRNKPKLKENKQKICNKEQEIYD